jgi:hypothetical protein
MNNIVASRHKLENYTSKTKAYCNSISTVESSNKDEGDITLCPLPLIGCLYSLRISISTLKPTEEMAKQ